MKIKTSQVPYIAHILTANGLKPDPSRVRAVEEIPSQEDKAALLRFLGMVNYISKSYLTYQTSPSPSESFCTRMWNGISWKGRRNHLKLSKIT